MTLGDQHQVVATREVVDRLSDVWDERQWLARDPLAQLHHMLDIVRPHISFGKPLKRLLQVFREGGRPVTVHADIHALDLVERGANLLPGHRGVAEEVEKDLYRL